MGSRWVRMALLGAALGLGMGHAAFAQVAAPSIVPGTFTSDNPAAIKWGAPSRFGFGLFSAKGVDQPGNTTVDYTGGFLGLRLVGESFAFGLQTTHMADKSDTVKDISDVTSANLALQTGNSFAWGLGYNSDKGSQTAADVEQTEPVFGVSIRLAEIWFIGATIGRETVKLKTFSPSTNSSLDRDTMRYGLGFRRGGSVLVHLEVFGGNKPGVHDSTLTVGSQDTTGGTMEFAFGPVLIAGSSQRVKFGGGIPTEYMDFNTADIGWAPRQGFSLVAHFESRYIKYDQTMGIDYHKEDRAGAMLTWQF